ncbi:MAG: nicotinate phosphoribosyltransferase [Myxococcota bacterium]
MFPWTTPSSLATDAYKYSMAQAGFPLRRETFYFSFRRGGPQFVPFDLAALVRGMLANVTPTAEDLAFARRSGYTMSDAMEHALRAGPEAVEICAVPQGVWVLEREPILSITGPSFLVSWLEPMLLWLNFPIQLATAFKLEQVDDAMRTATCEEHESIIRQVAEAVGASPGTITREDDAYAERVADMVGSLAEAVGTPERVFEVGMRSAVCMQQHQLALEACRSKGVVRTSNMHLARDLEMVAVGTMGHEHVQRWGNDLAAFEAMRDMRSSPPSYLLDTFDTMGSGIVAAVEVMRSRSHPCSIRYDSGNKFIQYLHACELLGEAGLTPSHVLEDGLDLEATQHFEKLRVFTNWPADKQLYGYGGTIVAKPATNPLTRDRVSAVFKLTETGGQPRMKFGNERGLGKQSVPGQPVVWRRLRGDGPLGYIAQAGETPPDDYAVLSGDPDMVSTLRVCNAHELPRLLGDEPGAATATQSPATTALVDRVKAQRSEVRRR